MRLTFPAMITKLLSRGAMVAALALALHGAGAQTATAGDSRPVVVELFTPQGSSSCPPADQLLAELTKDPGVLALSFHVYY